MAAIIFGAVLFAFISLVFLAGAADRIFVSFGIDYSVQVTVFRIAVFVLPTLAYFLTKRICEELAESRWRPIAGRPGPTVKRTAAGGFKQPTGGRRG